MGQTLGPIHPQCALELAPSPGATNIPAARRRRLGDAEYSLVTPVIADSLEGRSWPSGGWTHSDSHFHSLPRDAIASGRRRDMSDDAGIPGVSRAQS
jgi:hypothetical protein